MIPIKIAFIVCFAVACNGEYDGHELAGGLYGHEQDHIDYHAHPKYEFKYGVSDPHTKDQHSQHEVRDGDKVQGEYSLHEADGTIRTVKYTADHKNGFNAEVIRTGHAVHPETHAQNSFVPYGHEFHHY
ncbi:hypothetical protein FQA39_LY11966 [Lamprigera yunnana]|nr:hypothetical protein FQA39_LY11966 [Lamprigera yunnana]